MLSLANFHWAWFKREIAIFNWTLTVSKLYLPNFKLIKAIMHENFQAKFYFIHNIPLLIQEYCQNKFVEYFDAHYINKYKNENRILGLQNKMFCSLRINQRNPLHNFSLNILYTYVIILQYYSNIIEFLINLLLYHPPSYSIYFLL